MTGKMSSSSSTAHVNILKPQKKMKKQRTQKNYKLLSPIDAILKNSDVYVGVKNVNTDMDDIEQAFWCYYENGMLVPLYVIPALWKLFDELVVNVQDVYMKNKRDNLAPVTKVKIDIDWEKSSITVWNDGAGVPVVKHDDASKALKKDILCPELVWFHLNSGDNFEGDRTVGGKNGLGAKLAGVFSSYYKVKTSDGKKLFMKAAKENLKVQGKSSVKDTNTPPFTSVQYVVDLPRFSVDEVAIECIPEDTRKAMEKRIQDLANFMPEVRVRYNKKTVKPQTFKQRAVGFVGPTILTYEGPNYSVAVGKADQTDTCGSKCIAFTNGVFNRLGGRHVDQITFSFHNALRKNFSKYDNAKISHQQFRRNFIFLVELKNCVNSQFDGQCKDYLKAGKGIKSPFITTDAQQKKMYFSKLSKSLAGYIDRKKANREEREAKKTDGEGGRYVNVPDLHDAQKAGTFHSKECTLCITEGKSAKSLAVSMIKSDTSEEQKKWGVFPIRGKFINAYKKSKSDFFKNKEVESLKKALGLRMDTKTRENLRYGRVCIFTDADSDGYHIRMLLIAMFAKYWPNLLKNNFVCNFETPIVRAQKGSQKINFFDQSKAEKHALENTGWQYKYYKGLGTSTTADAKDYFANRRTLIKTIHGDIDQIRLCMGVGPDCDAMRRSLASGELPCDTNDRGFIDFIVKRQFANYAKVANKRKIPNMIDGLIDSWRKALCYALTEFKDNDKNNIVDRSGNATAIKYYYHHGANNLTGVFVSLAIDYTGSNNLPYLYQGGQFGTRHDDAVASGRYLTTGLLPHVKLIYRPEDYCFFPEQYDEGHKVEPKYLVGVIPMLLVNGIKDGMGVGYKSEIPPRDPKMIIRLCKHWLQCGNLNLDVPIYFNNFTGTIKDNYTYGKFEEQDDGSFLVTELPIRMRTDTFLKAIRSEKKQKDQPASTNIKIDMLEGHEKGNKIHLRIKGCTKSHIEKHMKKQLQQCWVVFDKNDKIVEMTNSDESQYTRIFKEFAAVRMQTYNQRKNKMIQDLNEKIKINTTKAVVIESFLKKEWSVEELTEYHWENESIVERLRDLYPSIELKVQDLCVLSTKLNKKRLEKNQEEVEKLQRERDTVEATSINDMWMSDLNELERALYPNNANVCTTHTKRSADEVA